MSFRTAVNFRTASAAWVGVLAVIHGVTFLMGRRIGRYNMADVAWDVGFVALATIAAAL